MRTKVNLKMCEITSVKEGESLSFVSRDGKLSIKINNAKTVQMENDLFTIYGEVSKNDCMMVNMCADNPTHLECNFPMTYEMVKRYAIPDEWADVDTFRAKFVKGFMAHVYVPDFICISINRDVFELAEEREIHLTLAKISKQFF